MNSAGRKRNNNNTNTNNFSSLGSNSASVFSEELENRPPAGVIRTLPPMAAPVAVTPVAVTPVAVTPVAVAPSHTPIPVPAPVSTIGPIAPPPIPIMGLRQIQAMALLMIKYITDSLYSLKTVNDIYAVIAPRNGQPPRDNLGMALRRILENWQTFKKEDLLNIFRFYIKGSSATVLLDELANIGTSRRDFPYSIDSDIDAQLLINPYLINEKMFKILRYKLMEKLFDAIIYVLDGNYPDKGAVEKSYRSIQTELQTRFGTEPVKHKRVEVLFNEATEDIPGSVSLLKRIENMAISDACPFGLRIYQNYGYREAGAFVPLNFTLIRVYIPVPNSTQTIDVLDISIPLYSLRENNKAWILSSDVGSTIFGYIQGPVGHYVNQSLTNRKMSRSGRENARKVTRRRERIRKIKDKIYKPHSGRLRRSVNTIRRGLRSMGKNEPLVAEILEELVA